MRKMVMFFIAGFAIIAVGLIIMLVYGILRGGAGFSFDVRDMKLVKTENVSLSDIDTITITYSSEDVEFYNSDTDELVFKEYMNYKPREGELSRIDTNGNELSIRYGSKHTYINIWPFSYNHRVEIYLPTGYSEKISVKVSSGNIDSDPVLKLSDFNVECSSGNIRVNEVYAGNINAKTSSGNITFQVAEGNRKFSATSGNIKVSGGAGDSDFHATSGNITVENAAGHIETSISSGDTRVINSAGGGIFEATSGNITIELTSLTESLNAHVSSGNIKLTIPSDAAFDFSADTSSGNINTFFDDMLKYNKRGNSASGAVGENSSIEVKLDSSSGNIRVSK